MVSAFKVRGNGARAEPLHGQPGAHRFDKTASISAEQGTSIVDIVPADFDRDGLLDVLVLSSAQPGVGEIHLNLHRGIGGGQFDGKPIKLPASAATQPIALDASGDLALDLLGHATDDTHLRLWRNHLAQNGTFEVVDMPLVDEKGIEIRSSCQLSSPHSSAFIDLDGDCAADLFLVCQGKSFLAPSFEVWRAKDDTFQLAQKGALPTGTGMLSFADMDRDGTIDVVFPSCEGRTCYINIAHNEQMPLCNATSTTACRDPSQLCTADPDFKINFGRRIPVSEVLGEGWSLLMSDNSVVPARPISLAVGDFNKDGYPDLLIVAINEAREQSEAFLLQNVPCSGDNCHGDPSARTFIKTPGSQSLQVANNVVGASFIDLDEDGTLDIMLQSLERSGRHRTHFVQNSLFYDSFFLKLLTLNGACEGTCEGGYKPWGVNYAGASYKFTVLDPNGVRRAQQVGQLAQTAYGALLTPSAYLGLGRTNNYVELLQIGTSRRQRDNVLSMEGVIPNSQIYINPWQPPNGQSTDSWSKEMYLRPGEWIPWVLATLVAVLVGLAGIVVLLHIHERVS